MDWILFEDIAPILLPLLLAASIPTVFLLISSLLGPRASNPDKLSPYECGIQPAAIPGDARTRFNVKFYLVAMCFLVFDIEVVFLFPWAVWFQDQAWKGLGIMAAFLGVLAYGWWYLWMRGGFEWE
jgi:NADH-quinone oxidoreductase subunit A